MIHRQIKFSEVPEWTYRGSEPSTYTFFSAIALAGLEAVGIRLSRDTQIALLGSYVFGKAKIYVKDSAVEIVTKCCFGSDWNACTVDLPWLQAAIASGKKISPQYFGVRYQERPQ